MLWEVGGRPFLMKGSGRQQAYAQEHTAVVNILPLSHSLVKSYIEAAADGLEQILLSAAMESWERGRKADWGLVERDHRRPVL